MHYGRILDGCVGDSLVRFGVEHDLQALVALLAFGEVIFNGALVFQDVVVPEPFAHRVESSEKTVVGANDKKTPKTVENL
jgi:hypothetical protein